MKKIHFVIAIALIAVLAVSFLYLSDSRKSIFTEKLGDMNLALYRDGDAAMVAVKELHGNNPGVKIENAYIANYRSTTASKAKFWVSESKNSEEASSLLEAMNSRVGKTGMFSDSMPLNMEGLKVYIQIDNPDEDYRQNLVKEAIKRI